MHDTNFYAIDVLTTGTKAEEPIQVAAILYVDGIGVNYHNAYFVPEAEVEDGAATYHGLTPTKLKDIGGYAWSKGRCKMLANFLDKRPDLPIVAHSAWY